MADTFASFNARIARMEAELSGPYLRRHMTDVGKMAQKVATEEASADLGGDPKFSGWPPLLDTKFDKVSEGVISFHPTRTSAGPWTVAERGRGNSNSSDFAGPGVNRRTGATNRTKSGKLRKVSATRARARKWSGYTRGKGTATRATAVIDKRTVKMTQAFVRSATRDLMR